MTPTTSDGPMRVTLELQHEIEQFYYEEAALLDERRYDEWLALFTDDTRYFMPTRSLRNRREAAKEFSGEREIAHFDDDKEHLALRVARLTSGLAWSEEPPGRTRHCISNVRIRRAEGGLPAGEGGLDVHSNFLVFHGKGDCGSYVYAGARRDALRPVNGAWQIAYRRITLDEVVLPNNFGVLV